MPAKPLGTVESIRYKIETNWPDTSRPENINVFGSYYAHIYVDVRNPGVRREHWLIETQKELFDKRSKSIYGGLEETLIFDNKNDAIAAAQFLQAYGRISAGWDHTSQLKHQEERRGPLNVRIVEDYYLSVRKLVDFDEISQYEIELAELKKKHNIVG